MNLKTVLSTLLAATCVATVLPKAAPAEDKWEYSVTPYAWYVWLDGDTGAEGEPPVESDASLFDILDGFFLINGEARRGKVSVIGEFNWVEFSDEFGFTAIDNTAGWELEGYMAALGAGYAVYERAGTRVELTAGVRYWDIEVTTKILNRQASADTTLTDPFIGARIETPISDRWAFRSQATIGVFGDTDSQFDISAEARWRWTERTELAAGARYLELKFDQDAVFVDASLYGPYAAISFRF